MCGCDVGRGVKLAGRGGGGGRRDDPGQGIGSPYRSGVSPRTKASHIDQSRPQTSSDSLSVHSLSSSTAPDMLALGELRPRI